MNDLRSYLAGRAVTCSPILSAVVGYPAQNAFVTTGDEAEELFTSPAMQRLVKRFGRLPEWAQPSVMVTASTERRAA
jgi:hypothetical protein